MTTNAAGVPDQREELSRKTFEALDWLFAGVQNGYLDEAQFKTAVDCLFVACCGLTDDAFKQLVTNFSEEVRHVKQCQKRCFVNSDRVMTLTWIVGEEHFTAHQVTIGAGGSKVVKKGYASAREARNGMADFAGRLINSGFAEL